MTHLIVNSLDSSRFLLCLSSCCCCLLTAILCSSCATTTCATTTATFDHFGKQRVNGSFFCLRQVPTHALIGDIAQFGASSLPNVGKKTSATESFIFLLNGKSDGWCCHCCCCFPTSSSYKGRAQDLTSCVLLSGSQCVPSTQQ